MKEELIREAMCMMDALDEENLRKFIEYLRFLKESEDSSQPASNRQN